MSTHTPSLRVTEDTQPRHWSSLSPRMSTERLVSALFYEHGIARQFISMGRSLLRCALTERVSSSQMSAATTGAGHLSRQASASPPPPDAPYSAAGTATPVVPIVPERVLIPVCPCTRCRSRHLEALLNLTVQNIPNGSNDGDTLSTYDMRPDIWAGHALGGAALAGSLSWI